MEGGCRREDDIPGMRQPRGTALVSGEATSISLLKTGFLALGGDLFGDPGVKGGSRGLAAGRGPVALLGHGLDHLFAVHGLAGLGQDLGGGVERAQLLGFGAGLLGLLGLAFLGILRCCHDTSPFSWGLPISGSADVALPDRAGSVLGCALKSRQFPLALPRFRQVLSPPKNLRNSFKLALRRALFR